jgi:hypothetical protein
MRGIEVDNGSLATTLPNGGAADNEKDGNEQPSLMTEAERRGSMIAMTSRKSLGNEVGLRGEAEARGMVSIMPEREGGGEGEGDVTLLGEGGAGERRTESSASSVVPQREAGKDKGTVIWKIMKDCESLPLLLPPCLPASFSPVIFSFLPIPGPLSQNTQACTNKQTNRQTDKQTDRQTDRQTPIHKSVQKRALTTKCENASSYPQNVRDPALTSH